ncbi:aminotransferase class I and II, partial [mine drainage metagenome]
FLNDALINPGEKAIIFKPYYTAYIPRLRLAGGKPIFENYDERDGWNIEIEHIRASVKKMRANKEIGKVKYILVTNPNNPTGTVLKRSILEDIAEIANDNDLLLISDEIYDEIVFNGAQFTSMSKVAKGQPYLILNGASKDFDATGFRLGLMLLPERDRLSVALRERLRNFAKVRLSVNTPSQYAFAEGISNVKEHSKAIKGMVSEIEKRVNYSYNILKKNEYIEAVRPNGAFYILPRLRMDMLKIKDDREFVVKLLKKEYIQLTRGSGFGAPNHFRIVLLPPKGILEYSLNKINDFCESISK